jgi:hypothetical protein
LLIPLLVYGILLVFVDSPKILLLKVAFSGLGCAATPIRALSRPENATVEKFYRDARVFQIYDGTNSRCKRSRSFANSRPGFDQRGGLTCGGGGRVRISAAVMTLLCNTAVI